MCDASDNVIGAVLSQHINKIFHTIYYESKALNESQVNYTTTEKELLVVVYVVDKFMSYLMYLLLKKEATPRIIRWFYQEIRDKKRF